MANPNIVAVVNVGPQFEAGQIVLGTTWTSDQPIPALGGQQGVSAFLIDIPTSTADYNNKVAVAQTQWFADQGVTVGTIVVGLQFPAMDSKGRAYTKAAGVESRTYGRYGVPTDAFDAAASATTKRWTKFPFPLDILSGTIYLSGVEAGDAVRLLAAPDFPLNNLAGGGPILMAPVAIGDRSLSIAPPVLAGAVNNALLDAGWWEVVVTDADGSNPSPPVLVAGYDLSAGTLNLDLPKRWSGDAGDEPADWSGFARVYAQDAQILVTRVLIDLIEIAEANQPISFGQVARGSSPFPKGVALRLDYTNNSPTDARRVRWSLDVFTGQV